MTNDILLQYQDQKEEIKDLRNQIERLKKQVEKIEQEGNVIDSVTGGSGGTQRYKIEGFPYPEYSKKKTRLLLNKAQLEIAELDLLETTAEIEKYIQSINNSRIRRIIRHRFIDNLTWRDVSAKIGGSSTDESVRKELERFLANN